MDDGSMHLIGGGGQEVVERNNVVLANPGVTGWQTAAITLNGTFDPDRHSCAVQMPSKPINTSNGVTALNLKYKLNSSGGQIDLEISISNTTGSIALSYEVFKVPGLCSPISRQQVSKSISTTLADNDLTITDPGGDWEKTRTILTHAGLDFSSDSGGNTFYTGHISPAMQRIDETTVRLHGRSYVSADTFTFWLEFWPIG